MRAKVSYPSKFQAIVVNITARLDGNSNIRRKTQAFSVRAAYKAAN